MSSFNADCFDAETVALLEAVEVPLSPFKEVDLDVAFGTPLEMYEPELTPGEAARFQAGTEKEALEVLGEFFARRHAATDILAADPTITPRLRERLVDVLLPYAAQLRIAAPQATRSLVPLAA